MAAFLTFKHPTAGYELNYLLILLFTSEAFALTVHDEYESYVLYSTKRSAGSSRYKVGCTRGSCKKRVIAPSMLIHAPCSLTHTIKALHLGLFPVLSFLQSLGITSLLAVEHKAEHGDDVGNSCPHRQADGLDHLVRCFPLIIVRTMFWLFWSESRRKSFIVS